MSVIDMGDWLERKAIQTAECPAAARWVIEHGRDLPVYMRTGARFLLGMASKSQSIVLAALEAIEAYDSDLVTAATLFYYDDKSHAEAAITYDATFPGLEERGEFIVELVTAGQAMYFITFTPERQ